MCEFAYAHPLLLHSFPSRSIGIFVIIFLCLFGYINLFKIQVYFETEFFQWLSSSRSRGRTANWSNHLWLFSRLKWSILTDLKVKLCFESDWILVFHHLYYHGGRRNLGRFGQVRKHQGQSQSRPNYFRWKFLWKYQVSLTIYSRS